jgi:hypothetical protein
LAVGEAAPDLLAQGGEELGVLGPVLGGATEVGQDGPALRRDRDLPPLPGTAADLHPRLEQGELIGPGGEVALTAEVVQLAEQRQQRVVGALVDDVLVVTAAQMGEAGAAPRSRPWSSESAASRGSRSAGPWSRVPSILSDPSKHFLTSGPDAARRKGNRLALPQAGREGEA